MFFFWRGKTLPGGALPREKTGSEKLHKEKSTWPKEKSLPAPRAELKNMPSPGPRARGPGPGPGARAPGPLPPNLGSGGLGTMGAESGVS